MLKIDLTQPTTEFSNHLSLEDNTRIIFSGIFGIGKTHFLKTFFEEKKEEYLTIHLFPVNYSVSKNEDIFELIKTDIIYEILLNESFEGEKIKFDDDLLLSFYLANNAVEVIGKFIEFVPEIGKNVSKAIENSSELIKKFKSFKNNMALDEKKELLDYLKAKEKEKGGVYESDFYTKLIMKSLAELAFIEEGKTRKKVLVIDDLDRIDPEHIFRLLNIFSAHFDLNRDENKFGFDKVIFVCDIGNIRNIFSSKYGSSVDFNGYLDKFYSREIFHFDNEKAIREIISSVLKSINYGYEGLKAAVERNPLVEDILTLMVLSNSINLRTLLRLEGKSFNIENKVIPFKAVSNRIVVEFLEGVIAFTFLNKLFGNAQALLSALEKIVKFKRGVGNNLISAEFEKERMEQLLILLDYKNHLFNSSAKSYYFSYNDNLYESFGRETYVDKTIEYKFEKRVKSYFVSITNASYRDTELEPPKEFKDFDSIRWTVEAAKILIGLGVLK